MATTLNEFCGDLISENSDVKMKMISLERDIKIQENNFKYAMKAKDREIQTLVGSLQAADDTIKRQEATVRMFANSSSAGTVEPDAKRQKLCTENNKLKEHVARLSTENSELKDRNVILSNDKQELNRDIIKIAAEKAILEQQVKKFAKKATGSLISLLGPQVARTLSAL